MVSSTAAAFAAALPERTVGPEHPAFDWMRLLFNGMHDKRPAVICLPRSGTEVETAIKLIADLDIPFAVRGAGHGVSGVASAEAGVVVDLRGMNGVAVDPSRAVARVGGGATWAQFDGSASRVGLATTGGTFDTTGVGGLTLGGGIGHLMGRCGLSCDNVLEFALVAADGRTRVVSPESDKDLDWALRGAGHNFGVVTEFTFALHDVSHVYGGYVAYPALRPAIRLFRDLMSEAPRELVCTLLLERHGPRQEPAAVMSVCYCGRDRGYTGELDRWLQSEPVIDWQIRPRSYLSMQQVLGTLPYGLRHYWSARCTAELPNDACDELVDLFLGARWQGTYNDTILIEPLHGAVREVSEEDSCVPFRSSRFNVTGMAIWEDPSGDEHQIAWARSVADFVEGIGVCGPRYINYLSDEPTDVETLSESGMAAFGRSRYDRLLEVKRRVDPENLFRSQYLSPYELDRRRGVVAT
jgi:hypothetical protein